MNRNDFLRALEAELALPPGALREQQLLSDVEGWDSMAAVQFIALAHEAVGTAVGASDLKGAKTVGDLVSLVDAQFTE